jgi:hypothetical protein
MATDILEYGVKVDADEPPGRLVATEEEIASG